MSISTNSKPRPTDDEIDLIPLLQALWSSKKTIIATTVAGAIASFTISATSPEQWTASNYITKSSLYSLYKEVKEKDATPSMNMPPLEAELYSSIQNDVFYTAMGVMAANAITLRETVPKTGKNESVLYIASATAATEALARAQLKAALDTANAQAIALNLPSLPTGNSVRAFNTLDEAKITSSKNTKKMALLGGFLGLILGSFFVIGKFLIRQYKHTHRS